MTVSALRMVRFAAVLMVLLGLSGGVGCQSWWQLPFASSPGPVQGDRHDASRKSATPTASGPAADARTVLANAGWARSIAAPESAGGTPRRWRHSGMDDLLSRAVEQRPDFRGYLRDSDTTVAANAAIALSRLGDASGIVQLGQAIRAPQRLPAFRCAAIEALAEIQQPTIAPALRELLEQYGDSTGKNRAVYQPDLHAELLRGLARHVDPVDEPWFVQGLESPAWAVRLEAVQAWQKSRTQALPSVIGAHHADSDARVRAAVLRLASSRREATAPQWCKAALADTDFQVRLAAIAGLGDCNTPEAVAELMKLAENGGETHRAAAISALAAAGSRAPVAAALKDSSPLVRRAVAEAVVRWPDREGAALAVSLLDDPSREVQQRLFAALADWPLPQLGPVLLTALEKPGYLTRRNAATLLATRWPPAADFPLEAVPTHRAEALARLQERFRREVGFLNSRDIGHTLDTARQRSVISSETLARLEVLLQPLSDPLATDPQRREAVRGLAEFGPELLAGLEQLVLDRKVALPPEVYAAVLPKCDACFAEIDKLGTSDVLQRRKAADALAVRGAQRTLSALAVSHMHTLAIRETDQQVWRSLLTAVAADPSPAARQLAATAAGHPAPEVRRRACIHLGAHPAPQNAALLVPLLEDPNRAVVSAAIEALGRQERLDDTTPLRRLLTGSSETSRHEATVALARLGDPAGREALERMVFHPDPAVRREAALVLAELEQTSAIPLLVGLLDDRPGVSNAALAGLVKLAGRDVGQVEGQPPATSSEQIRRWKDWLRQRQGAAGDGRAVVPDRLGR